MPNYTYHCENCAHEFDRQQSFSDNSLKKCPNCSKHALRKVYKPARVVFKGSGYYVTDNKSKSAARASSNGKLEKSEKPEKTAVASKDGEKKKDKKTTETKKKAEKSA